MSHIFVQILSNPFLFKLCVLSFNECVISYMPHIQWILTLTNQLVSLSSQTCVQAKTSLIFKQLMSEDSINARIWRDKSKHTHSLYIWILTIELSRFTSLCKQWNFGFTTKRLWDKKPLYSFYILCCFNLKQTKRNGQASLASAIITCER